MNSNKYKDEWYEVRPIANLKELVRSSAELYGDRAAFLVKDKPGGKYRAISYAQLGADVDALGTALVDLGLGGKKIGVIGENRYDWVVTYLATVNGVGVIVPLDRELPVGEIYNLMKQSGLSAIIYSGKVEHKLVEAMGLAIEEGGGTLPADMKLEHVISMDAPEHTEEVLSYRKLLQRGEKLIAGGKRFYMDTVLDPEIMCMLLFTSGTTGMAKGVMLSHKNLAANVYNMSKYVDVTQNDTVLSVLPMHHTLEFTCDILTPIYQGCTVAICEGLKHVVKNMAEAQVTGIVAVPLIFESMHKKVWKKAEAGGKADKMRYAITVSKTLNKFKIKSMKKLFKDVHQGLGGKVRLLICGGAAINPAVVSDFNAMGFNMIQGYGMTECAPIITVNMDRHSKDASVGLPMPGTEVKIVDPDENGVGEIICRSDSVMLGYYNNPEETAKVLRDGWLYTGDLGFFDKDGYLYISGRKKNVIVTKNGKNIFPEEVEFYLGKSDFISETMVWGMDDEKTGETLVCAEIVPDYAVIEEKIGKLPPEELMRLMKRVVNEVNDQMPLYKRVKRFELRETEFEKTTTKKIKRYQKKA